jgi:hypothetical protein
LFPSNQAGVIIRRLLKLLGALFAADMRDRLEYLAIGAESRSD